MSFEEAEVLRERAYAFLRNAKRLFEEREFDLAAFSVEQFFQLILKYKLLVKTGTYPRTHSIVRLLRVLDDAASGRGLASLIDSEIMILTKVEDAYVISRYFPRRYEEKEVKQLIEFADKFEKVIRNV
ncbi:MAG: HEPN domain-containing protein [Thermoproteota archaeon]